VKFGAQVLSSTSIAFVDLSLFAHATEDERKVLQAAQNLFPAEYLDIITFKRQNLRGHHRNPIVLFETRIKDKEIIKGFIENLSSKLSPLDKQNLQEEISRHVEKGSLYLRLDKQAAFRGALKLCTADPIRLRIRFRKRKPEDVANLCKKLGILP
jgi:hypothetical protein